MTEHDTTHDGEIYRAGFACLVGRPNAGKSTLTNALVGDKVAITSSKPQTTRHTIRGIVTRPDGQIVLVDNPGLHKPRTLLGERLNDVVRETLLDVDVIRPKINETTALGAAYAAGLAVGFWKDLDDLRRQWAESKRWEPSMDDAERQRLLKRWGQAVERTLDWAE